jgi:fluoroquinolone resistance protein
LQNVVWENEGAALTAPFSCALKSFASFSQFRLGTFKTSEFNGCNLAEADFHGCDLRGALLKSCEFKNADMTGAQLECADFRGSRVEGLMALATDLKGAIVDPAQAMVFAELLGLKIR